MQAKDSELAQAHQARKNEVENLMQQLQSCVDENYLLRQQIQALDEELEELRQQVLYGTTYYSHNYDISDLPLMMCIEATE